MRRNQRLSGTQILLWSTFGLGTGLLAGFALGEWVGGVNQPRVRRAAKRLGRSVGLLTPRQRRPVRWKPHWAPSRRLSGCALEVVPISRRSVELRGWVKDRPSRALAARVASVVPGVETVINSILVRGEDDRVIPGGKRATDQSA